MESIPSRKRLNDGSLKGWLLGLKGYWAQIHNLVMNQPSLVVSMVLKETRDN